MYEKVQACNSFLPKPSNEIALAWFVTFSIFYQYFREKENIKGDVKLMMTQVADNGENKNNEQEGNNAGNSEQVGDNAIRDK